MAAPSEKKDMDPLQELAQLRADNEFLRNYARQCDAEMKIYQSQLPEVKKLVESQPKASVVDEELPPWMTNSRYMSPLLVAYEARVRELSAKNQADEAKLAQLQGEVENLAKDKAHLQDELESNIQKLLQQFDAGAGPGAPRLGPVAGGDDTVELQERLALMREEVDILHAQEQKTRESAATVFAQLQAVNEDNAVMRGKLQQLQQLQTTHEAALAQLKTMQTQLMHSKRENDRQSEQLRAARAHKQQQDAVITELKTTVAAFRAELQKAQTTEIEHAARTEQLERALEDAEEKNRGVTRELDANQRDLEGMVKALESMEKTLQQYKQRELGVVGVENESRARQQEAELRRDQAQAREEQLRKENDRLHKQLREQAEELHKQSEISIENIYKKSRLTEEKLKEEIKALERTLADDEAHKQQAHRDIKALQARNDALGKLLASEQDRLGGELQTLRANAAALRAEAERQAERAQTARDELDRLSKQWESQREVLMRADKELRAKCASQEQAIAAQREQTARLTDTASKAQAELEQLGRAFEQREKRLEEQVLLAESGKASDIADMQTRVEEAYRMQEESEERAAKLLKAQEELVNKWREENRQNMLHFQRLLREQKQATARLSARNLSLEARVQQLIKERDASLSQAHTHEAAHKHAQSLLEDVDRAQHDALLLGRDPLAPLPLSQSLRLGGSTASSSLLDSRPTRLSASVGSREQALLQQHAAAATRRAAADPLLTHHHHHRSSAAARPAAAAAASSSSSQAATAAAAASHAVAATLSGGRDYYSSGGGARSSSGSGRPAVSALDKSYDDNLFATSMDEGALGQSSIEADELLAATFENKRQGPSFSGVGGTSGSLTSSTGRAGTAGSSSVGTSSTLAAGKSSSSSVSAVGASR